MNEYKYILEPYKSSKNRYKCPNCGKANQFTRYINRGTNKYVADNVGICNRIEKCGYHLTPKTHSMSSIGSGNHPIYRFDTPEPITPSVNRYKDAKSTTFLDRKILLESYEREGENFFMDYLKSIFGEDIAQRLKKDYLIGTNERGTGRVDFFQVDVNGKVRQAKNMGYDPKTGKKKDVYFSFSKSKYPDYNLVQCFFGEHLLKKYPDSKVAIVESEKTAIIASVYISEFVWIAAGNANGLNLEKTKVLSGREVVLFPDLGQYDNWKNKISSLNPKAKYSISKLLETKATESERDQGYDIADYLVKTQVKNFRNTSTSPTFGDGLRIESSINQADKISSKKYDPDFDRKEFDHAPKQGTPKDFNETHRIEIESMETFFRSLKSTELNAPISIGSGEEILDPNKMIGTHLAVLKSTKSEKGALPYYMRLVKLRESLLSKEKESFSHSIKKKGTLPNKERLRHLRQAVEDQNNCQNSHGR